MPTLFDTLTLGINMRGRITDLHIYSEFYEEKELRAWTSSCSRSEGDIFSWDTSKLNTTQKESSQLEMTIEDINKNDICPDPNKHAEMQQPTQSARTGQRKGSNQK